MDRNQGTGRNGLDWDLVRLEIEMGIGGTGLDWGLVRLDIEAGKVARQQQKHTCPPQTGAVDATEAGASGASADRSYCFRFPYSRIQFQIFSGPNTNAISYVHQRTN